MKELQQYLKNHPGRSVQFQYVPGVGVQATVRTGRYKFTKIASELEVERGKWHGYTNALELVAHLVMQRVFGDEETTWSLPHVGMGRRVDDPELLSRLAALKVRVVSCTPPYLRPLDERLRGIDPTLRDRVEQRELTLSLEFLRGSPNLADLTLELECDGWLTRSVSCVAESSDAPLLSMRGLDTLNFHGLALGTIRSTGSMTLVEFRLKECVQDRDSTIR